MKQPTAWPPISSGICATSRWRPAHRREVIACKLIRRNRTSVFATAAVGLALIVGAGIAIGQAVRATKAERRAEQQLQVADEQRRWAEATTDYLVEALRSPDPAKDGRTVTVAEVLDQAKRRLETDFQNEPVLKAKLLLAMGRTYIALGLFQDGNALLEQSRDIRSNAFGSDSAESLEVLAEIGEGYQVAGRHTEGIVLLEKALPTSQRTLGAGHPITLTILSQLGQLRFHSKDLPQAIELLKEAYERCSEVSGPDDQETLSTMRDLAAAYGEAGQSDKAIQLGEEALKRFRRSYGEDHPETLVAMNQLSMTLGAAARRTDAIALLEDALPRHVQAIWTRALQYDDFLVQPGSSAFREWRLRQGHRGPGADVAAATQSTGLRTSLDALDHERSRHGVPRVPFRRDGHTTVRRSGGNASEGTGPGAPGHPVGTNRTCSNISIGRSLDRRAAPAGEYLARPSHTIP